MQNQKIKTRFAPSPTGYLHIGGLRTALYAYLFAKKNHGDFLLRIEDTDQSRKVEGADEVIKHNLKAFGLHWKGKVVYQSTRLKKYQAYARTLIEKNAAYYCFCTPEEVEKIRQEKQAQKLPTLHSCDCPNFSAEEIGKSMNEKKPYVIRMRIPKKEGNIVFNDLVREKISFAYAAIDDQILLKSDGFPTYHLANVVDDHEMGVTHVLRGEEWLSSTPKHVLLYEAFGWQQPAFAHLPLLLNPDKSKLSKRQGDVAVSDYLEKGYLPEALLNFVLLLGWNPGTEKEIFSFHEMIESFDITRVNKSGAVFDVQKLEWLNGQYIRQLKPKAFAKVAMPFFKKAGIRASVGTIAKYCAVEQERIKRLDEIVPATAFFFSLPEYETTVLQWKESSKAEAVDNLKNLVEKLASIKEKNWNVNYLEAEIKEYIAAKSVSVGSMLWPMRVALSGRKASPGPFEIAAAMGKKETLIRLNHAIKKLQTPA